MIGYTLHQCNWDTIKDFEVFCTFISENDALLIYSKQLRAEHFERIAKCNAIMTNNIYIFTLSNPDNLRAIDYSDWVRLTENYKKIYTWK